MNIEEFIVRLHIEEDNPSSEKKMFTSTIIKANVIEYGQNSK